MAERVHICDIAEELGLSTATVSNVIHGKTGKVSAETAERVTALLEEREYIPSMAGIRVPEDISITGFDDNILSRVIRPRLTTVHQNVTRKAQTALHALFDILDKTAKEPVSLVLPTRIIRGSSVKDLRLNRTMHTNLTE